MINFKISLVNLFWLHLIFPVDYSECCTDGGPQLAKPVINQLTIGDEQSLTVSWLVNRSGLVGGFHELQISRTEKHIIIYKANVSVSSGVSSEYTWTWISELPLECVDHSVRIRNFDNQSVPSPWSNWKTNYGWKAENETKIFPFQQVLREGSSPMFCCVPPAGENITGMTFRNTQYPLISIGDRVKAIVVKNLTIPTELIKSLLLGCSRKPGKPCYIFNYVSSPPQKPRNFSCATSDLTTVTCTWELGNKGGTHHDNLSHVLCIENSNQDPINCHRSSCTFPAVPHLQKYNISVVVKNVLGEAKESYSFNIADRVFPVVEWDRVSPGVTEVTISWSVQGNLTQMDLLCQVSTVPDSITEWRCNSASGPCKVKLEYLLPNTHYSSRVRCSVNGKLWGDWTKPTSFITYPLVTLDLWRRIQKLPDSHSRRVTLLWNRHIVGTAATVNIQGYRVQWSEENQICKHLNLSSGQNQAEVLIGRKKCDLTAQAVLHTGSSILASITIPPMDSTEILPIQKRLSGTAGGGFNLSWNEKSWVTCSYTVEWCILGNRDPCTLKWMKVPKENTTLFLPAENFTPGRRYTFNIYGCTENEHRLLEIQTGYSQELKSVQSPRLVEPVQKASSSVTLEWHYNEDNPAEPAFITGYLITVQEVRVDVPPAQGAIPDPRKKSVTIEGLQQNTEYSFSVSALTKDGPGLPVNIIIRTGTNWYVQLAKILTPVLLLLGCTILLWSQRKMLKRIFVYPAGMDIKIPEFEGFLYETTQRLESQNLEECLSCDIEIISTRPPLNETTILTDPELVKTPCAPGSQSSLLPSHVPLQTHYCPHSDKLLWDKPAFQQTVLLRNKSYVHPVVENSSEPQQVTFSEVKSSFEPSDYLQESCSVIYGYISNDKF